MTQKEYISPDGTFTAYLTVHTNIGTRIDTEVEICKNDENVNTLFGRIRSEPVISYCDYWIDLYNSKILWSDELTFQINNLCLCVE